MNYKRILEPVFNSAVEILPLILVMVTSCFFSLGTAAWIGVISYVVYLVSHVLLFERRCSPSYMICICGAILIFYIITKLTSPFGPVSTEHFTIICEVLLIVVFSISLYVRTYITSRVRKQHLKKEWPSMAIRIDEFFYVSRMLRNMLAIHLLIVLLYKLSPPSFQTSFKDRIFIPGLLLLLILLVVTFETFRIIVMKKKINQEAWLPIVNETGGVIGKIAQSVDQTSRKSFLHPVVRIAFLHQGMFYLKERPGSYATDPGKLDYPFEKFVYYSHSLEEAVGNILEKEGGRRDLPVKFVFRYLFKNQTISRLIYLYTCRVNDEDTMKCLQMKGGKLWTEKQIEENLGKGVFSEYFEKEFEILKATVLMAEKIATGT